MTRRKLLARVTELEELLEQAKLRIIKLEKDKSKFQLEIRDISIELETVSVSIVFYKPFGTLSSFASISRLAEFVNFKI